MGQDIAGPQQVDDLRHQFGRLHAADMAHDLRAGRGPFARCDCALERLGAVFGNDVLGHADFGAKHDIRVLADRSGAGVHLRKIDIVKLGNRKRRESDIGNMYKCVESRATLRHDVAAEGRKIIGASIARRNARGAHGARVPRGYRPPPLR